MTLVSGYKTYKKRLEGTAKLYLLQHLLYLVIDDS